MRNLTRRLNFSSIILFSIVSFSYSVKAQNIAAESTGNSLSLNSGFKKVSIDKTINDKNEFDFSNVTFNTKDSKIGLNFYHYINAAVPQFISINASGKAKNDITNIFSTGNVVGEVEIRINYGIRLSNNNSNLESKLNSTEKETVQRYLDNNTSPAQDLWLVINGSLNGYKFKRFTNEVVFSDQIIKESFTGYSFNMGLNYWNANISNNNFLAGFTIGIKQTNNFDDLIESTREDKQLITDASSNIIREITVKETVYQGNYNEYLVVPVNLDLFFAPHYFKNLSLSLFSNVDISEENKPMTRIGTGFYILNNSNIFNPIGGISFSYKDVFNVDKTNDDKGMIDNFSISLSTRINIFDPVKKKEVP